MPLKNSVRTQPASTATARYHASLHSSPFFPLSFYFISPPTRYHCDSFPSERRNIAPSKLARPSKHLEIKILSTMVSKFHRMLHHIEMRRLSMETRNK